MQDNADFVLHRLETPVSHNLLHTVDPVTKPFSLSHISICINARYADCFLHRLEILPLQSTTFRRVDKGQCRDNDHKGVNYKFNTH